MEKLVGSLRWCGNPAAHYPHATGSYDTVRHGTLDRFCPGLPGPGVEFRVVGYLPGDPTMPDVFRWVPGTQISVPGRSYLGERVGEAAQDAADQLYAQIRARVEVMRRLAAARERLGEESLDQEGVVE